MGGLAVFAGGFWALFKGFLDPNVPVGILGGVMIPLGLWIVAQSHRGPPAPR
ncbi:MAG: hypothetical protein J4F43_06375 [Dehalococcoidia bacterium]|nr:hypothetical protein [Dehalococcoidia bacterium]